jgi:hypothetical protein
MCDTATRRNVVPFVVRQDGRTVEQRETYQDAVALARDLKRAAPEMLISVWDLVAGEADIITEALKSKNPPAGADGQEFTRSPSRRTMDGHIFARAPYERKAPSRSPGLIRVPHAACGASWSRGEALDDGAPAWLPAG